MLTESLYYQLEVTFEKREYLGGGRGLIRGVNKTNKAKEVVRKDEQSTTFRFIFTLSQKF